MSVNETQVGGNHYKSGYQHWDFIEDHGIGYLEAAATKYVTRWRKKNGRQDLEKALHYTQKLLELHRAGKRLPRGIAPLEAVRAFSIANKLSSVEDTVMIYLARWVTADDILAAIGAIERLIVEADALGSGQKHPFGYDGEE